MALDQALTVWRDRLGQEIACSPWQVIDQPRINDFAEATLDRQFIHIDPERAAQTPFGETIAHGFLTMSLMSQFYMQSVEDPTHPDMIVNYGFEKLRFITPVRAGEQVRGRFVLHDVAQRAADQLQLSLDVTMEIKGRAKPALVARWLILSVFSEGGA